MTKSALVTNFLDQYRKPFDMETAAGMTGLSKKVVRPIVTRAKHKGQVKEIEPGIYIRTHHERISNSATSMPCGWKYSVAVGTAILELLERKEIKSVRTLGTALGKSRQYAYIYLEGLASLGAVQWDGSRYLPTGKGSVLMIGCQIEKGILGRMIREARCKANV